MKPWPNQSPEPTPIGHRSSAVAVHVANTASLSFSLGSITHHTKYETIIIIACLAAVGIVGVRQLCPATG